MPLLYELIFGLKPEMADEWVRRGCNN
jgi:hypothetical protein